MKPSPKKLYLQSRKRYFKGITGTSAKLRLSVFRSHKHIYAQLIDDEKAQTLAAASSLNQELRTKRINGLVPKEVAFCVGKNLGRVGANLGIKHAVFDRGNKPYHGRIQRLAEGAREAGLTF
ncbi:MAG: 50S ribosomal protein L18 [Pedobacter sp.]|nr:MAG: 50S ribosomal protein L18 [Pedobacter sp.]